MKATLDPNTTVRKKNYHGQIYKMGHKNSWESYSFNLKGLYHGNVKLFIEFLELTERLVKFNRALRNHHMFDK